jgi:chorismate mutase/prephenate dehydratase
MTLESLRKEIDEIDGKMLALFLRRMKCGEAVARVKRQAGLPVFNAERERQVLASMSEKAGAYGGGARLLFSDLMALSRTAQHRLLGSGAALRRAVESAGAQPPRARSAACLGREGSFSHEAARRLFPGAQPLFFPDFSSVFAAVARGAAQYGVLPVENSSAGSVGEVYDLLLRYRFSIAAAVSLPVRHCLASSEKNIEKIQIVYSHPQALRQCAGFLRAHSLKAAACSSTAQAAQQAQAPGAAAVCSPEAAKERGLNVLARDIQDCAGNRTRFVAVGKGLLLPPGGEKISLCFSLPHRTGTLASVLARFAAAGLNLTKIESRPIPERNFEYDFYLDFSGSVRDAATLDLLCALSEELPRFSFLGNYAEVQEG